ncbi:MAG: 5'/3'-nucleotidase SurE [Endomicrobiaceae bacterium]|jgi:5'-nucleotidase|nr:5'/3'-nucleotidase SurE [Endomicrobiaceae bacterium]MDD3730320.1 5'/3'-nucleotidase SurE [Endomicrobiaceae bacterium]MDD4166689.1 5'/3'-nucleotidase SurE [Endomicrobiaceae bacterium]
MNILISNDDGIKGKGLKPLIKEMSKLGNVYVIVPEHEMSGMSQSITLDDYRQIKDYGNNIYSLIDGTPTDCVKFGLYSFLKDKIDLVISGINTHPNLGQDVVYSGTVACAREGAYLGIPSMAVSVVNEKRPCFEKSAAIVLEIAKQFLKTAKKGRPAPCLNVNIPPEAKGIKVVSLGIRSYDESIVSKQTGKKTYYKLAGRFICGKKNKGTDIEVVEKGFVAVTPLLLDQTHHKNMAKYKYMEERFEK